MSKSPLFQKSKLPPSDTAMPNSAITGARLTATFDPPFPTRPVPLADPSTPPVSVESMVPEQPEGPPQPLMPVQDAQAEPAASQADAADHAQAATVEQNMEQAPASEEVVDPAASHHGGEVSSSGVPDPNTPVCEGDDEVTADLSAQPDEDAPPAQAEDGLAKADFCAGSADGADVADHPADSHEPFAVALDPAVLGQMPEITAPLDRLQAPVAEFIKCVAASVCVSESFVTASVVSSFAVAIGMSRVGRAGAEWTIPPVLWFVNNSDASAGKTPAMNRAMAPLDTVVGEIVGQARARTKPAPDGGLRERIVQKACDMEVSLAADEPVHEEKQNPFICHILTLPGIEEIALGNSRQVLIRRDEIIPLLKTKDPELRAALLSAYDGASFRRTTGKRHVYLPHLGVWIIGGVQPDKLAPLLDSLADDGLGARILPVVGSMVPLEQMGGRVDDGPMKEILRQLFALKMDDGPFGPVPHEIPFSPEAQNLIFRRRQMSRAQADEEVGMMVGMMGKSAGTVARLALVLGLVRAAVQTQGEPEEIEAQDVHDAAALFDDFFVPMARAAYDIQSRSPIEQAARKLVKSLKVAKRETVTVRELQRTASAGFNKGDDFLELLVWLEAKNILMWLGAEPAGPRGGAPSPRYAVHPQIWQRGWVPGV